MGLEDGLDGVGAALHVGASRGVHDMLVRQIFYAYRFALCQLRAYFGHGYEGH